MRSTRPIFLLLVLASMATMGKGQVNVGTPPFGSFGGGPDVINLANLNAQFTIPVFHKPGRGTGFSYDFGYNTMVYYLVTVGSTTSWVPANNMGWVGITQVATGSAYYATVLTSCTYYNPLQHQYWTDYYDLFNNYSYVDSKGTPHPYAFTTSYGDTGCKIAAYNGSGVSIDGSGLYMAGAAATTSSTAAEVNVRGGLYSPPMLSGSGAASFTDTNGNELTANSSGQFFDTLSGTSNPALTVTGAGTPASPVVFTYSTTTGGTTQYTMNYASYNLKTNFGCASITEYAHTAVNLPSSISLPDGSSYTFTYEPTPGYSGYVTGRLQKITFPTGGSITYTYTGGSSGHIVCADGSTPGMTRVLSDGGSWSSTWTYSRTAGSGAAYTTTVTDPQNNVTTVHFQGLYETQRVINQGSSTVKETINTCYNGAASPCTGTAITLPITQLSVVTQLDSSGAQTKQAFLYNSFGQETEEDDYDFGSSGPGSLLKKTLISYASLGGTNMTGYKQSVTIQDGSGNIKSRQDSFYDQSGYDNTACISGVPQHDDTGHGCTFTQRGNLTSVTTYTSPSVPSGGLTQTFAYDNLGNLRTVKDALSNTAATYSYTDSWTNSSCQPPSISYAYPTTITNALSQSTTLKYYACDGQVGSTTDPNAQTTSIQYDSLLRPTQESFPDGGQTNLSYSSPTNVQSTIKINSTQNLVNTTLLDGLGRTKEQQVNSDPDGVVYVDTTYDPLGRVYTVSNPYRSTSDPTYGLTAYAYDVLNRTTQITHPDSNTVLATYTGRATKVQDEGNGNGTSRVTRISQMDGLGRLSSICEVSSATLSGAGNTPVACSQDIAANGFLTSYLYDALNNITQVSQSGLNLRAYAYDALSRLSTATDPETGTVTYTYDANSNLQTRKDARNITTTFAYDTLNRLTSKTYSDGTPTASYSYDNPNAWGQTLTNVVGRMVTAATSTGNGEDFSYDPMGRVIRDQQCIVVGIGGCYATSATYNSSGLMSSFTGAIGIQLTYGFNSAVELNNITSSLVDAYHPATLLSGVHYNALGQPVLDTVGSSSITDNYVYTNRGWIYSYWACINATYPCPQVLYTFNMTNAQNGVGYAPNGNILVGNDSANGNWLYGYDDFNRLISATCASGASVCPGSQTALGYQYKFDRFGNRWQQNLTAGSGTISNLSFNANNRIVPTGNCTTTFTYCPDSSGNLLNDGSHSYTYDAENRVTSVDGGATATYTYDAQGRRVSKVSSAGTVDYFYDMSGHQSDSVNAIGYALRVEIYAGSRHLGAYVPGGMFFSFTDWLGTDRVRTSIAGATLESCENAPYGDMQSCTNTDQSPLHFTDDERDPETNLDHMDYRQYSSALGRWITADPAGQGAVDPTNPQSWNQYAYVLNNPVIFTDPLGLTCDFGNGNIVMPGDDDPSGGDAQTCTDRGGTWIPDDQNNASVCGSGKICVTTTSEPLPPLTNPGYGDPSLGPGDLAGGNGPSWLGTFIIEFLKFSGGPGNVPTCAEKTVSRIFNEFVPYSPTETSVIQATGPAVQAAALNNGVAQTVAEIDAYVKGRGLIMPLKSKTVRAMSVKGAEGAVEAGARANLAVQTLALDYATVKSGYSTMKDARNGDCAAAVPIF